MKDLSLHILDIAQNAIDAGAKNIWITVEEDTTKNTFVIRIEDDGCGMSREVLEQVTDPYYTSRVTRKVGLGIPLFKQNAEQTGGYLKMMSEPGKGTIAEAVFVHDHIDRPDLGDIAGVMVLLIGGKPDIRFRYLHKKDGMHYTADTKELEEALEDMPVSDPGILKGIKEMIIENLKDIGVITC